MLDLGDEFVGLLGVAADHLHALEPYLLEIFAVVLLLLFVLVFHIYLSIYGEISLNKIQCNFKIFL